jgi:tocopherol O-methyltransferase
MITPTTKVTSADVAAHYNDLDRFYRRVWGEHVHHGLWVTGRERPGEAVEQLVDLIAQHLRLTQGHCVCDVGCGYGATARRLAEVYGAQVTGLTISETQFQYAAEHRADNGNPCILLQDWETNKLPSESFEAVVSIECLSHIQNKDVFFRQIYRVLRPGGRAVITVWLAGEDANGWRERHLLEPICREGRLPGMGNRVECAQLLEGEGLRLLEFQDLTRNVRKTWRICAQRALGLLVTSRDARRFLFDRRNSNAVFFLSVFRILAAYRMGAMQYGLLVMDRPK